MPNLCQTFSREKYFSCNPRQVPHGHDLDLPVAGRALESI